MHFAARADVVIRLGDARFIRGEHGAHFELRPGEIVAVVVERLVRVLAGEEAAARWIGKDFTDPGDDAFGGFAKQRFTRHLKSVEIIPQKFGIVVGHFLEMRDAPALVDRIAVKATADLVVDAAERHAFERAHGDLQQLGIARRLIAFEQQIDSAGVREFRLVAEAAVRGIELTVRGMEHRIDHARIENAASAVRYFRFGDGFGERVRGLVHVRAPRFECVGNREQDALEAGAAASIVRREIGAAEKRLSVRSEEGGERPAALSRKRADRGLIARVDVGAFIAIDFHRDVELVDHGRDLGIFVAFAVDYVAPVAPDGADIEQDRFFFGASLGERFVAPFVPVDRLMRGGAQVGAGGVFQAVFSH